MEFGGLPVELRLKIFSYLPQDTLLTIADVSREWKELAFDPLLWTRVNIDSSLGMTRVVEILERATLVRSFYIARSGAEYLDVVAPALPRYRMLNGLIMHKDMLSHGVMRETLKNCPSLCAVVLLGELPLVESEVGVLSTLPHLMSLVLSKGVRVPHEALRQLSRGCPGLRMLEFNSDHIFCRDTLAALSQLQQLTCLSVTGLCKDVLPLVSVTCPHLEYLHIGVLKNADGANETAIVGKVLRLRLLTVNGKYWNTATSRVLTSLQSFDVPEMCLRKRDLQLMLRNWGQSVRYVEFNAIRLAWSVLDVLSICRNLEVMHIYGLSGDNLCLAALAKFPKLLRASLNADESAAAGAIQQLPSMVDVVSQTPPPLHVARLALDVFCSSQTSRDAAMPAVSAFKDFILSSSRVSKEGIVDRERRGEGSRQWARRTVITWFPPVMKTLMLLELILGER